MNAPGFIFIGGSRLQEAAFHYARELEVSVALIDRAAEPHCGSLALRHYPVDGTDVDNIVKAAMDFSALRQVVGAYCNNDFGLVSLATLNHQFGLRGPNLASASLCRRKDRLRAKLIEKGVAVPRGMIIDPGSAPIQRAAAVLGYPFVLKPVVGSGSRGVAKIEMESQIDGYAAQNPEPGPLLAEEFINGSHHDVNGLMLDGNFFPCGIADRFFGPAHYPAPADIDISPCLPVLGICPSALASERSAAAYALVARAAVALGIDNSPLKADLIWSARGPYLLEVAPRFHGEIVTAYLMPEAMGQEPIKDWLRFLVTGNYGAAGAAHGGGSAWMAILPPRGKAIAPRARRRIAALPDVAMLDWRFGADTGGGPYRDNTAVRGLFVVRGSDGGDAAAKARVALGQMIDLMDLS